MVLGSVLAKRAMLWLLVSLLPTIGFAQRVGGNDNDNTSGQAAANIVVAMGNCEYEFDASNAKASCPSGGATNAQQVQGVWNCSLSYDCSSGGAQSSTTNATWSGPVTNVSSLNWCGGTTFTTSSC